MWHISTTIHILINALNREREREREREEAERGEGGWERNLF